MEILARAEGTASGAGKFFAGSPALRSSEEENFQSSPAVYGRISPKNGKYTQYIAFSLNNEKIVEENFPFFCNPILKNLEIYAIL
ncbi:hypothetical protein AALC17_07150 [Oscillospiraceae bacterium 38-13]